MPLLVARVLALLNVTLRRFGGSCTFSPGGVRVSDDRTTSNAAKFDPQHIIWHWDLFGDAPREGRAIHPDRSLKLSTSVRLNSAEDALRFVRKWADERIVCFSVQPVAPNYKGGRACHDADIPAVTRLFFDFDGKPGTGPALAEKLVPHLQRFCERHDFKQWSFAVTDKGVHAYAAIPAVDVKKHKDFANRVAYLTTVVLKKEVASYGIKTDSVFNLSRVVKIVGTTKPPTEERPEPGLQARFLDDEKPELEEDPKLRDFLLKLKLNTPAVAEANDKAAAEPPDPDVLNEVARSTRLREIIRDIGDPAIDRSKLESVLVKELWRRGFRNTAQVAKFMCSVQGSKCKEQGYTWAHSDVRRLFQKEALETKEEPKPATAVDRDLVYPNVVDFLARPITPIRWLFPGLIAKGMRALFAGEPKTLKSWAWVYLALHVANLQQKVLYLAGEGHEADWHNRIKQIAKGHGINIAQAGPNFRFGLRTGIDLGNRESLMVARALIADEKPALVICDTMRSQLQGDENDSAVIAKIIQNLDFLVEDMAPTDVPCLAIVHHTSKGPAVLGSGVASKARGSSALWGHVDTTIISRRVKKNEESRDSRRVKLDVDHRFSAAGSFLQAVDWGDDLDVRVEFLSEDEDIPTSEAKPAERLKAAAEAGGDPEDIEEEEVEDETPVAQPTVPTPAQEWTAFLADNVGRMFLQKDWSDATTLGRNEARAFFNSQRDQLIRDGRGWRAVTPSDD